jgi:hypothetical protein
MSFEGADIFLIDLLGWIYDKLEVRFGRAVAWIVTFLLSIGSLAAIVGVAWYLLRK